ncbi:hypothetical protein L7F22_018215 [Adiantum nelumboides]|nr:hypothetical protein [Adiantum nelumboides]
MTRTPNHLEGVQETTLVDDVQTKNLFSALTLTKLDSVYNMVVSKYSFALSEYNEAFQKLEFLQADMHQNEGANLLVEKLKGQLKDAKDALLKAEGSGNVVDAMKELEECAQVRMDFVKTMQVKRSKILFSAPPSKVPPVEAEHFTEVEFAGGNKCEEHNSKVLVHDEKEDVLDKEAEPDAEVEIVGGYNCEEHDPKVEVHVEKEAMLEKYSLENGDQAENFPSSMKDNEVSARDTSPSILQTIQMIAKGKKEKDDRKATKDAEGQTNTSKDQLEKEIGENSNMESRRKDVATSNIDNLDHIISMIAKSTMKDPLDVDTSFRVEGQVPCASNIEDQADKNIEFVVLIIAKDTEIIMKRSEPLEENGDASVDAGGYASCAGGSIGLGDDMKIIIDKYEPSSEHGDAPVDASGAVGPGSAGEDTKMIIEKYKPPQEDGDASVDAHGDASCAGGAIGARGVGEDMEIIIEKYEPPQEDGDASVDAGGDGSCATGAVGAGGVEYVRHNDGTVSRQRED